MPTGKAGPGRVPNAGKEGLRDDRQRSARAGVRRLEGMQPLPGLLLVREADRQADQGGAYEKRDGGRGGDLQTARRENGKEAEGRPGGDRRILQARHKMGGIAGAGGLPDIALGVGEGQEKQGQADEDGRPGLRSDSGGRLC